MFCFFIVEDLLCVFKFLPQSKRISIILTLRFFPFGSFASTYIPSEIAPPTLCFSTLLTKTEDLYSTPKINIKYNNDKKSLTLI